PQPLTIFASVTLAALFFSPLIWRLINHCCTMVSVLFVTQYSVRPAGNENSAALKASGISHIILACTGSAGAGCSETRSSDVAVIRIGRIAYGSMMDRSWIQPIHGAPRISADDVSTVNSAMKIGIWMKIGRQPPSGLTFSSR